MPPSPDHRLRAGLLAWYDRNRRALPWRDTRDPYRVWVSEIMLQQTTVRVVLPYYEAFLANFPDLATLAAAPLDAVLARWSGLGYYSRARNLHAAAQRVMDAHGGAFPTTPEEVRDLPGIGDYTTAAILSIVNDAPLAVVDGNVIRVMARLLAAPGHARSTSLVRAVRERAQALLDPARPGDFNQAVMELGATVCTPKLPACVQCPFEGSCAARALGTPLAFPAPPPKTAPVAEKWLFAVLRRDGHLLMRQRPVGESLMGGLWELPSWALAQGDCADAPLLRRLVTAVGFDAEEIEHRGTFRHAIMNRRLTCEVVAGRVRVVVGRVAGRAAAARNMARNAKSERSVGAPAAPEGYRWVAESAVSGLGTSSTVRKALRLAALDTSDDSREKTRC